MPQSDKAFITPAIINPDGRRCVILYIPDEELHIANFWGSLLPLAQWLSWERDAEHTGKELAQLWKEVIFDAWDRFERRECCEQDEECDNCSNTEFPLGLSYEELEQMVMGCLDISESIRQNPDTGLIEVWDCHDGWVPLTNQTAAYTSTAKPPDDGKSLSDAIASGILNLTKPGYIYTPPPQMNTVDSQRCSKATAMIDAWLELESKMKNVITALGGGTITVDVVVGILAAEFFSGGTATPLILIGVATGLSVYLAGVSLNDISNEIEDDLDDSAARSSLICALAQTLLPAESGTVDGGDMLQFNTLWENEFEPTGDLKAIMGFLPSGYVRDKMMGRIPTTICDCEDMLPYSYSAAAAAGFNYHHKKFGAMPSILNNLLDLTNALLGAEDVGAVPAVGTLVNGKAKTVYAGVMSGNTFTRFHWILELSEAVTFSTLKVQMSYSNLTNLAQAAAHCYVYDESQAKWLDVLGINDTSVPIQDYFVMTSGSNLPNIKYISFEIFIKCTGTAQVTYGQVQSVLLDGVRGGAGFTDLPIT